MRPTKRTLKGLLHAGGVDRASGQGFRTGHVLLALLALLVVLATSSASYEEVVAVANGDLQNSE